MATKLALPLLFVVLDKAGDVAVTAPTCTTAGYTTYTCDCGESYVDNLVDALGHNYVLSGNLYTCSRCGDSYTGHEHSYTEETTEPTCTESGYTVYTCACGDSYRVNLPKLGHNYVLIEQNVSDGKIYRCTRCGATYTEGGIGINPPIDPDPPVNSRERNGNTTLVTEHHQYIYASGKLLREVITTTANGNTTTQTLDFTYDGSGYPYALTYTNGTATPVTYYYIVNLQGDVLYLVDEDGTAVAEYGYDAWGKVLSAVGSMAEINPLRYRGYCYDADTQFYYLQSRFYDPEIRRFVNADGIASTGQGFLGYNSFAYCNSNPISASDPSGYAASWTNRVAACDGGTPAYIVEIQQDPAAPGPPGILPTSEELYWYLVNALKLPRRNGGDLEVYISISRNNDELFVYHDNVGVGDIVDGVGIITSAAGIAAELAPGAVAAAPAWVSGAVAVAASPWCAIAVLAISLIPEGKKPVDGHSYPMYTVYSECTYREVGSCGGSYITTKYIASTYLWSSGDQSWYEVQRDISYTTFYIPPLS